MVQLLYCTHCGNVVEKLNDTGVPVVCCGEPMQVLTANTTDAAQEKHVPVVTVDGSLVTVTVGSVEHPMLEEHSIRFILLETQNGVQRVSLSPATPPKATFALAPGDAPVAAYEWCNLHGLWKADI